MISALLAPLLAASLAVAAEPGTMVPTTPSALERAVGQAACSGEYADAILAESPRVREFERQPGANYAYCLRNTAVYECLYYGSDAKVRKRHVTVVAHGTAFAYRQQKDGETLLLTNDHVATWPAVTSDDTPVDDVPNGCKKVDEQLRIVKDESDDYEPGQIAVQKVVTDHALDAAVLKTRARLNILPYRIGRSALLRAGNIVEVRGYPLGLLEATNSGKVVDAYDLDRENGWYHTDFITDALVTKGNSGSPVLAISCRTGELELVGLYHAGYRDSPALNAVIGIDQLRDLMDNFKRSKPPPGDEAAAPPGPELRQATLTFLATPRTLPLFALGDRTVRVRAGPGGTLFYDVFASDFPSGDRVSLTLEESPAGQLAAFSANGKKAVLPRLPLSAGDAQTQDTARKLYDLARRQLADTLAYRVAAPISNSSRAAFKHAHELSKALTDRAGEANELIKRLEGIAAEIAAGARGKATMARAVAQVAAGLAPPAPAIGSPDGGIPAPPKAALPAHH